MPLTAVRKSCQRLRAFAEGTERSIRNGIDARSLPAAAVHGLANAVHGRHYRQLPNARSSRRLNSPRWNDKEAASERLSAPSVAKRQNGYLSKLKVGLRSTEGPGKSQRRSAAFPTRTLSLRLQCYAVVVTRRRPAARARHGGALDATYCE